MNSGKTRTSYLKKEGTILLLLIWLAACSPQVRIDSTPVPTFSPTQTQTLIPSPTSTLTSTPTITFTSTATLEPSEITFDIGDGVPNKEVQDIQLGLERIRLYLRDYMGGDISPDIRKNIVVKIVANGENRTSALDERGITLWFDVKGVDWARGFVPAPFRSLSDEHIKTAPHEYVHGWQSSLGCLGYHYNLLGWWMSEGIAEYVAYQTAFQHNLVERDAAIKFMLQSAEGTEASVSLQSLESTFSKFWPGHIGFVAIDYLMQITQANPIALRVICEQAGDGLSVDDAFKNAFGISRPDFYKEFQEYMDSISTQQTGISGKITWSASYPSQGFNTYILNFCPKKGGDCFGATEIQPDGTFLQSLPPGSYLISLNLKDGSQPIGWYSINGAVKENACAETVRVKDNEFTNIVFFVASPIACP